MAYTKYKDIPHRREPQGGRDHIQHIENGLTAASATVDALTPRPGHVIVGGADGPVETPIDEIGGGSHPVELPSIPGLYFHLDAQSITAADGSRIASWTDEVSGTVALSQATPENQPAYDVMGINGRPALVFDSARNDNLSGPVAPGSAFATVLAVVRKGVNTDTNHYFFGTTGSPKNLYHMADGRVGAQSTTAFTADAIDHMPQIVTGVFNDAASALRIDGVATTGTVGTQTTNPGTFVIGHRSNRAAGQGFTGHIGEVLYYNRALSDAECASVERYLASRWGVPVTPQTTWHIDSVHGDDARTGRSAADAIKTFSRVFAGIKAAKATDVTLSIFAPESNPIREPAGITLNSGGTIRLVSTAPGQKWHMYGAQRVTSGWTSAGGGVYSRPFALAQDIAPAALVPTLLDTDGQQTRIFARNTATPTTPAAGEYGYTSGTYYLHLPGDENPNAHTVEIATANNLIATLGGTQVYGSDAALMGAQNAVFIATGTEVVAGGFVSFTDSDAWFSAGSGWGTSGNHRGIRLTRCRAWHNLNDGFNHHGSAGNTAIMELIDCEGFWNSDEGVSPHDDTRLILRGGSFHHNSHGGLTSVGNAVTQLSGTEFYANRVHDTSLTGTDSGGVAILEQSRLISTNLYSHDHPGPGVEIDTAAGATWTDNGGTRSGTAHGNGAEDVV